MSNINRTPGPVSLFSGGSNAMGIIDARTDIDDPEGKGRQRHVAIQEDEENHLVVADVFWEGRDRSSMQGYIYSQAIEDAEVVVRL